MKRLRGVGLTRAGTALLVASLLVGLPTAQAQGTPTLTTEVLVATTATALPKLANRKAIEIQNLGPNAIFCALGSSAKALLNKARKIDASGGVWALDAPPTLSIYCITSTLQVTGAATVVTELR